MLVPDEQMKIFVALKPVDMRKSINGLIIEILDLEQGEPQSGNLFIFHNKKSDLIKAVFWHIDGFVLVQKRLEKHKFKFPSVPHEKSQLTLNKNQFNWLLSGFDFTRLEDKKGPVFTDYH